jgi:hypothetical protein
VLCLVAARKFCLPYSLSLWLGLCPKHIVNSGKAGKALKFRSLRNQASTPKLCCFLSPCPDGIFYFAYGFLHLTFSLPQHATSFGLFITCRFAYFALGSASSIFHFPLQFILVHYNAPKRCGVSRRQLDDRARREFASYQNRSYGIAG